MARAHHFHPRISRVLKSGTALGIIAAALTGPAAAQVTLEEITVTAQKRSQNINEVPMAISAFTPDSLRRLGISSAEDMETLVPGLEVNTAGGVGTKVWTIRGVGFNDYSAGASSTVGIYMDEVAIPYPVMATGMFFDTDRVEVLKGPQGDLYGRNTTAGQISYFSARPTDDFEGGIKVGYGNYETFETEGYVSGPIADGVRARLAFATKNSGEGWQTSASRPWDKLGQLDKMAFRASLSFDLSENATIDLTGLYNEDKSENVAPTAFDGTIVGYPTPTVQALANTGGALEQFVPFSTGDSSVADWTNGPGNALRPQRDNELKMLTGKLTWDIGEMELVAISSYAKFDRSEANDWDGTALLDSSNINVTDIETFSQEVRLSSEYENWNWVAGVYYSWDEVNEDYNYFFGEGRFGIQQLDTRYDQTTESYAAFAHAEFDITDEVGLIVGARYTDEEREWAGCTYDATPPDIDGLAGLPLNVFLNNVINGPGVLTPNGLLNDAFNTPNGLGPVVDLQPGACGTFNDLIGTDGAGQYGVFSRTISTNKMMWKIGLDYRPTEDLMFFGTVSQGFKSGGFNGANSNTHKQLVPYKPEELLAFEIGLKATLADGAMQFNTSAFYYDYKDKQENESAITPVGNISGLSNIPKSEVYGMEFELNWRVTEALRINAAATIMDSKVKEWMQIDSINSAFPTELLIDVSGAELPNAPNFSANLTAAYDIPVSGDLMLTPGFDVIYRGSTSGDLEPAWYRKAYTIVNARMTLSDFAYDRWSVQVWARNLLDKDYYVSGQTGGNFTYARTNAMPRTYGITLDYSF